LGNEVFLDQFKKFCVSRDLTLFLFIFTLVVPQYKKLSP